MTCNACGRDLPLADKRTCVECYEEGPFTRAERAAHWQRRFAWWPERITEGVLCGRKVWLRWIEVKEYQCFGANRLVRVVA